MTFPYDLSCDPVKPSEFLLSHLLEYQDGGNYLAYTDVRLVDQFGEANAYRWHRRFSMTHDVCHGARMYLKRYWAQRIYTQAIGIYEALVPDKNLEAVLIEGCDHEHPNYQSMVRSIFVWLEDHDL